MSTLFTPQRTALIWIAAAVAVLAGCAAPVDGRSGLSPAAGTPATMPMATAPITPPTPTLASTHSSHPNGTSTGGVSGGGSGGGASKGSKPPPKPPSHSASPAPGSNPLATDYFVKATTACYWRADSTDEVVVGTYWVFGYSGLLAPADEVYVLKNTLTSDINLGTYYAPSDKRVAVDVTFHNALHYTIQGHTVTLRLTVSPRGPDDNPSDNIATITATIPTGALPGQAAKPLQCH